MAFYSPIHQQVYTTFNTPIASVLSIFVKLLMLWCCVRSGLVWLPITYLCKQRFYPLRFVWRVFRPMCGRSLCVATAFHSNSCLLLYIVSIHFVFLSFVWVCSMCVRMNIVCTWMCDAVEWVEGGWANGDTFLWNSINFGNLEYWFVKRLRAFNWTERCCWLHFL